MLQRLGNTLLYASYGIALLTVFVMFGEHASIGPLFIFGVLSMLTGHALHYILAGSK